MIRGQLNDVPRPRRAGDQLQTRVFALDEFVAGRGGAAFPLRPPFGPSFGAPLGRAFPLTGGAAARGRRLGGFFRGAFRLGGPFTAFPSFAAPGGVGVGGDPEFGSFGEGVVLFQKGGIPLVGGFEPFRFDIVDGVPLADLLEPGRKIVDRHDLDVVDVDAVKI